jgi:hypothetical protein
MDDITGLSVTQLRNFALANQPPQSAPLHDRQSFIETIMSLLNQTIADAATVAASREAFHDRG